MEQTEAGREVSIVIPAYNEEKAITQVLQEVRRTMEGTAYRFEIVVVDDGSSDRTAELAEQEGVRVLRHPYNRGTGASLKTGIRGAKGEWVAIIDADGTYPAAALPQLLSHLDRFAQVVGARTEEKGTSRLLRTAVKTLIRKMASFFAGRAIPDLNSGMRAFRKADSLPFLNLCPDGFSFVSSIALAFLTNGLPVAFVPIDYHTRIGKSKFHPVMDTYRYFLTVIRIISYFAPLNVFMPISLGLVGLGMVKGLLDFVFTHTLQESDIVLLVVGFMMGMLGILADLIVAQGKIRNGGNGGNGGA